LTRALGRDRPRELGVDRQAVTGEYRDPHAGAGHPQVGQVEDLADSLRSLRSSSVSPEPSSSRFPASATTLNAMGATYLTGSGKATAAPSCASASMSCSTAERTCPASSS